MTESPAPAPASNRLLQYGALGAAVLLAFGAGLFVFLSNRDDAAPSAAPASAVRAFYASLANGESAALPLLAPEVQEGPAPLRLAFPTSGEAIPAGGKVAARDVSVREVNNFDGWASVRARGSFTGGSGERVPFDELVYVHNVRGTWLISSSAAFEDAAQGGTSSRPGSVRGELGPLVPQRPKVGEPAPDFALLDARDGSTIRKLSDYRGQAVVLNWYASWCGPCKAEIPEFQAAYEALGGQLVVLGIDYLESQDRAQGILDIFHAKYPAVLDSEGLVAEHYRVGQGLPTTFFVDKEGVLRGQQVGQVRRDDLVSQLAKLGLTYTPK